MQAWSRVHIVLGMCPNSSLPKGRQEFSIDHIVPLVSGRGAALISRDGENLPRHQLGASLRGQHPSPLAPILCMPLSVFATVLGGSFPLEAPVWLLLLLDKRPHSSAS